MATPKAKTLDYQQLLANDPILKATLAASVATGAAQKTALSTARQQALIGYGAVPTEATSPGMASILGGVGQDITPETQQLAGENTAAGLSTLAQLQKGYRNQQGASVSSLASRGMLHSGAFRQHSLDNIQNLQVGDANAQQGLLASLGNLYQGYQGQQQQNASTIENATGGALSRILGQVGNGTLASPTLKSPIAKPKVAPQTPIYRSGVGTYGGKAMY